MSSRMHGNVLSGEVTWLEAGNIDQQQEQFYFNSLWPSDAIWQHRAGSTLAQVVVCCLMAPSHYLNQCWLIVRKAQCHSLEGNSMRDTHQPSNTKIAWKFQLILSGANELNMVQIECSNCSNLIDCGRMGNWPQFGARSHGWPCHHALVGPKASLKHGNMANHGFWYHTVVNSCNKPHWNGYPSPNRTISKKLGLKTILLISFRST